MKPLKTFLFIMKHGRMRLRLVKRVREEREVDYVINKEYRTWYQKPDPKNKEFRRKIREAIKYYDGLMAIQFYSTKPPDSYWRISRRQKIPRGIRETETNSPNRTDTEAETSTLTHYRNDHVIDYEQNNDQKPNNRLDRVYDRDDGSNRGKGSLDSVSGILWGV